MHDVAYVIEIADQNRPLHGDRRRLRHRRNPPLWVGETRRLASHCQRIDKARQTGRTPGNPRRFSWRNSSLAALDAIRKKRPDTLARPDLEMVALDYFRRLGHDNHRRLSKLYAWEEKKNKTSWVAQTVDYEKIAADAVHGMKAADLRRFLVVCALVSDLCCPGYNPRQSLEKNSNLARTAARYKIAAAKTAVTVRAELSSAQSKANS